MASNPVNAGTSHPLVKVMHVITSLDVGGAETILARLVAADQEGSVTHTVVSLKPGGALRGSLEATGNPVLDLGIGRKLSALSGLARLTKLIKTTQPDIVHSWLYHADLLATLAVALSGRRNATRLLWGVRCSDMDMLRYARSNRYILKMLASLSSRTDLVLCNSNAGRVAHERLGYRPPRWLVIPNGLDVDRFAPRPDERATVRSELGLEEASFVVGMCARVDPMKDHDNFVKAAAMFAETAPEARFALIGAGTASGSPMDGCIRNQASPHGSCAWACARTLPPSRRAGHRHPELGIRRRISQRPGGGDGMRRALRRDKRRRQRVDRRRYWADRPTSRRNGPGGGMGEASQRGTRRSSCARRGGAATSRKPLCPRHDDRGVSWVVQRAGHAGKPAPRPGPVRTPLVRNLASCEGLNKGMCGFVGFVGRPGALGGDEMKRLAARMADRLESRGPDDAGTWVSPSAGIALGHRRLAVIDLTTAGRQPMVSASGRSVIAYNGEVYNFGDIRRELEAEKRRFRGNSDTEVLLEACEAWGVEHAVSKLIGMFAFAFWDDHARRLTLVRDRLGIKPLYWGRCGGVLFFGSQPKGFVDHPAWRPVVDRDALAAYLRHAYVPAPHSIFKGIEKLEPGSIVEIDADGRETRRRYWDLRRIACDAARDRDALDDETAAEMLDTSCAMP